VFLGQHLDRFVFFQLNLFNRFLALGLHSRAQQVHVVLEFQLDLRGYAFMFLAQLGLLLVEILLQRVQELLVTHLLLLLLYLDAADILLQFAFSDTMLVFVILERYLRLLSKLGKLVEVVENQML